VTLRDDSDGLLAFDDEGVFDFTDDGDDGDRPATRRLATGTMPRLELAAPEPPDSRQATTRMSLEEVLELRAESLQARQPRAPTIEHAPDPVVSGALPTLVPVSQPAWRRIADRARAAWAPLVARRWQLREVAIAFAAGILFGFLATC